MNCLLDRFALVFDAQTTLEAHYVVVLAFFRHQNTPGYRSSCLALSPLEYETTQESDAFITFLWYDLKAFGKDVWNVAALVGDDCNIKRSISTKLEIPLLGCDLHQFQLAVEEIIGEEKLIIATVQQLMMKVWRSLMSAKLQRHTVLRPRLHNATRWSSRFLMLHAKHSCRSM